MTRHKSNLFHQVTTSLLDGTVRGKATFLLVSERNEAISRPYVRLTLWSAIRFVLSDAYTSMSREERLSLLHEGVANATVSAYVEIVFDNSGVWSISSIPMIHFNLILRLPFSHLFTHVDTSPHHWCEKGRVLLRSQERI